MTVLPQHGDLGSYQQGVEQLELQWFCIQISGSLNRPPFGYASNIASTNLRKPLLELIEISPSELWSIDSRVNIPTH